MAIIDVDAHFEPAADWLDDFPGLADRLPEWLPESDPRIPRGVNTPEAFAFFMSDDLLRGAPAAQRMPIAELLTPHMHRIYDPEAHAGYEGASMAAEMTDVTQRIAWMDAQGIDKQNVISGTGYTLARVIEDPILARDVVGSLNTWMADAAGEHADRLMPVTTLRFDDLDWAVAEMARMRERGSRMFVISSEPVNGLPPTAPEFDQVWSAATDLGMVALLHIGMAPAMIHPGWANTTNPRLVRVLSVTQPAQSASVLLHAMILEGVFERHPNLTLLLSELGIDWFTNSVDTIDLLAMPGVSPLVVGDYDLPLTPKEYVRRNVRISPLPAPHQSPVDLLAALPECAVFSSDYPHHEGNPDPAGHYERLLRDVDDSVREGFLHGNIEASFALTGDPL
ncbi:MAG: amidohydrolase family protein [Actinobacteria bacterium]|nr:amidohydrolase family protein [Actinomycetota bacterium]